MPIYLIRHTEPARNKGICYGQSDLDVADTFEAEVAAIKQLLPESFNAVYSSPLQRCSKLAEALFPTVPAKKYSQLMELDFGTWEMKYWGDIPRAEMDAWTINFVDNAPPLGESFRELYTRAVSVWDNYLLRQFAANTAVVTHAGVIRALVAHVLEIPLRKAFSINLKYGAVVQIDKVGKHDFQISFLK